MVRLWASSVPFWAAISTLLTTTTLVHAQGCSSRCPPINYGTPVPSLCEGDLAPDFADVDRVYTVCHPQNSQFRFADFKGRSITVVANYYTGCNAGRRESGVFAHVAQRYYNAYGSRVTFVQSVKGGGTCNQWAGLWQEDAARLYPNSNVVPQDMPLSVNDVNYEIRDDLFTTPFGHPSYVILDADLRVRHKFIGPCCGYESYFDCTADIAKGLDDQLSEYLDALLAETDTFQETPAEGNVPVDETEGISPETDCGEYTEWSACSVACGTTPGIQFRWSASGASCPSPIQTRDCLATQPTCEQDADSCIPELGVEYSVDTVEEGFNSPRDVAFHPSPGYHLGEYSEGRTFDPTQGEEAWVVNSANHSVSIVAALGTAKQTTMARRDRGYYHYMINATALAFNSVGDSNRLPDRDSFNYWAICNDNLNTYLGTKEPNYFMGPTLYDSNPRNRNVVNRLGEECGTNEPCYFLHADMLHEAPACIGIAHDPETTTAYGNVYWAFDATGNRQTGQLVRFDFQQPHGPGSMDHSVAAIRRYTEIELIRGPPGVHAGMVVHPTRRELYVAVPGANKIVVVGADSGSFARSAREEFPIFSSRLPSFEYSIWECVDKRDFATDIDMPTGLALSPDGERLFGAERGTGTILVFEIVSGALLESIPTNYNTIGGMSFAPTSQVLHFVDEETNTLNAVVPQVTCIKPKSYTSPDFVAAEKEAEAALGSDFSLLRDYQCVVNPVIPDSSFFDQVHVDTGYADENPDVQSMAGMDETAALLANRTDCGWDSELNFDALLLGGFFCHPCLPEQDQTCDVGGSCTNVQWDGYLCDNEFHVKTTSNGKIVLQDASGSDIDASTLVLRQGVTYRFVVEDMTFCVATTTGQSFALQGNPSGCTTHGSLLISVNEEMPSAAVLLVDSEPAFELQVETAPQKSGLSSGAIAGVVVGSVVVVLLGAFAIYKCCRKDKGKNVDLSLGTEDNGSDDQNSA